MAREFLYTYTLTPVAGEPGNYTVSPSTGMSSVSDTSNGSGDNTSVLGDVANDGFTANGSPETYAGDGVVFYPDGDVSTAGPIGVSNGQYTLYSEQSIAPGTTVQLEPTEPGSSGANQYDLATGEPAYCFMAGTSVRTPDGDVAVETLRIGDAVLTADGALRPVKWLGRQTVSTRFGDALRISPVRVKAGALADGLPARDLLLSPDHALLVDGVLAQAGALINGTSIVRETGLPETFVYYHVELADHALILAEGVPAETFIDNVDRLAFDNWDEHVALYPNDAALVEMEHPRAKSHRQVPGATRQRLAARGEALYGALVAQAA